MYSSEIISILAKKRDISVREAKSIYMDVIEIFKWGLIDSDKVVIGDIGSIELQSLPPVVHNGVKKERGQLIFKPNNEMVKKLIALNIAMIEDEETER